MRLKRQRTPQRQRRGFTLLDLLVSIAVIIVLIGLLLPALGSARETANRVVCRSNVRQIGLGLFMYADSHQDFLPHSVYAHPWGARAAAAPQEMMHLRLPASESMGLSHHWDGLGVLYSQGYLPTPKIFYCPSYHGSHTFDAYAEAWLEPAGAIVGNFHYREFGPKPKRITLIPPTSALLADGLRTAQDFSHVDGSNLFRADLSVEWFADANGSFLTALAFNEEGVDSGKIKAAWMKLDTDATK